MKPLNPKSASALSWFALVVNVLGLIATALSAQFFFSVFAAFLSLFPAVFARKKVRIFGIAVFVLSLTLMVTGYPKYKLEKEKFQQRIKAIQESKPKTAN
jgi:VIT1/CCC1 family predicted Fe2+/Mn2+ transporter